MMQNIRSRKGSGKPTTGIVHIRRKDDTSTPALEVTVTNGDISPEALAALFGLSEPWLEHKGQIVFGALTVGETYDVCGTRVEGITNNKYKTYVGYREATALHDTDSERHPERPARVVRIIEALVEEGLYDVGGAENSPPPPRDATEDEVRFVHGDAIVAYYGTHPNTTDTYVNEHSRGAVLAAVGTVLTAVDNVLLHKSYDNAFCVVRPPGHHCGCDAASGFCLVNNVAIAARYSQKILGVRRVAIVDFDVHHGDGTQKIFEADPTVLYMSLHRHDGGSFYPYTGAVTEVGVGNVVNVAIDARAPAPPISDYDMVEVCRRVWLPALAAFAPDLLLVSAGYDAAKSDPLGHMAVTARGYAGVTSMLNERHVGRTVMVLEGGYNLGALRECVTATVRALRGEPISSGSVPPPLEGSKERLDAVIAALAEAHKELPFRQLFT